MVIAGMLRRVLKYAVTLGAYKYINELYKKKQSDVLRFLLRVRFVYFLMMNKPLNCRVDAGSIGS